MPGKNFDDASIRRIARSVLYTEGVRQNPQTRRRRYVTATTPEIHLGELTTTLVAGGSCSVQPLILVDDDYVSAPGVDPVTVHDPLEAMSGEAGDRCFYVWNCQAGQFWMLQKNCTP